MVAPSFPAVSCYGGRIPGLPSLLRLYVPEALASLNSTLFLLGGPLPPRDFYPAGVRLSLTIELNASDSTKDSMSSPPAGTGEQLWGHPAVGPCGQPHGEPHLLNLSVWDAEMRLLGEPTYQHWGGRSAHPSDFLWVIS